VKTSYTCCSKMSLCHSVTVFFSKQIAWKSFGAWHPPKTSNERRESDPAV